jgi:hypothetical protein
MPASRPPRTLHALGLSAVLFLAVALPLCLGLLPQDTLSTGDACATASEGTAALLAALGSAPRVALPAPWIPWVDAGHEALLVARADACATTAPLEAPQPAHAPNESRRL